MADESENFEYDGNDSINDLIARMGAIDKAIEDIHDLDKKKDIGTPAKGSNFMDTPEEKADEVEDMAFEDDDDDDDVEAGLEDMQKEMQLVDEEKKKGQVKNEFVTVSCVKPTPEAAIGISMKTSKGITKIVSVNPVGLLAKSQLVPIMQLISVNGMPIKNAKHAKWLIDMEPRQIVLVARTMPAGAR